jgi:hypothetical protein
MSTSFLFHDWRTVFDNCKNDEEVEEEGIMLYLCFVNWKSEVIFGVVFVSVIFVTVINYTCELSSRPVDCCCENDNYKNLVKAIALIKSQCMKTFNKACCCLQSNDELQTAPRPLNHQRMIKVPAQLAIPSLTNGGLTCSHVFEGW